MILCLDSVSFKSSLSSSSKGCDESNTKRHTSHSSIAFLERSIPIFSTTSVLFLIPAVSTSFKVTFPRVNSPSIISLVVPAISVTIALSSSRSIFNSDDFPTLGRPTIAVLTPLTAITPKRECFKISFISVIKSFTTGSIISSVITTASSYSG